nr:hypothetical protein [uncultured Dyadobacter sp.]
MMREIKGFFRKKGSAVRANLTSINQYCRIRSGVSHENRGQIGNDRGAGRALWGILGGKMTGNG